MAPVTKRQSFVCTDDEPQEFWTKHREGADCPNEEQHTAQPRGYAAWDAWSEQMQKTHVQRRCEGCNRWAIWVPK